MVSPNKKRDFSHYLQDQEQQQQQPLKRKASIFSLLALLGTDLSSPRLLSYIETSLFRPVVRDEVERQVKARFDLPQSSSSSKQVGEEDEVIGASSGTTKLKLCLVNKVPSIIFTDDQIEAENGQALKVVLWDITTNRSYNLEGTNPLSSAMIEFVVLDGEFGSALRDQDPEIHWSVDKFNKSIVTPTVGERPLLFGNDKITHLKNGVAFVNDLIFTANSSRNRTKMIRLGVRVIDPVILNKYPRIGEAISDPFRVKDHRGKAIKKNYPPKGDDEVYRLEGIGKDRCTRLANEGIRTVDDFVKAHQRDPHFLRQLLGKEGKRVSDKQWNGIVKHASEYVSLIPTLGSNSQLNNQTIMNPTTYNDSYNEFGDTLIDQFGLHQIFQGYYSTLFPSVGEASTSNTHHYEVENSNPLDQHLQEPWPRT